MVRVITHELPSLNIYALDILTGKRRLLETNAEWDASGEVVEDSDNDLEDERDLFDSDSPVTPEIVW